MVNVCAVQLNVSDDTLLTLVCVCCSTVPVCATEVTDLGFYETGKRGACQQTADQPQSSVLTLTLAVYMHTANCCGSCTSATLVRVDHCCMTNFSSLPVRHG